jgi:cytochrome c-type biogenesis protein CcmH
MNDWDKAEDAYRHAIALGQTSPDILGDHAEILVMQAGGTVTPAAEAAFQILLKADPNSGLAHYYLALAALQAGEPKKAIEGFQAVLAQLPTDSPVRAQVGLKVAEAAHAAGIPVPELAQGTPPQAPDQPPGPDANAVAAASNMTDEQRQAMIQGMVAQLAAKQAADPTNLDGWMRLGRAYTVLHEPDKAADAFDKAAALKPDDPSIPLQEVRALLADHTPAEKLPPRVLGLLQHLQATDPDQPVVLWFLGIAAAQDAHPDDARRYWGKLLTKLPPGSEDAKMIQSALDTLSREKSTPGG